MLRVLFSGREYSVAIGMNSCGMMDVPNASEPPHSSQTLSAQPITTAETAATDMPNTTIRRIGICTLQDILHRLGRICQFAAFYGFHHDDGLAVARGNLIDAALTNQRIFPVGIVNL